MFSYYLFQFFSFVQLRRTNLFLWVGWHQTSVNLLLLPKVLLNCVCKHAAFFCLNLGKSHCDVIVFSTYELISSWSFSVPWPPNFVFRLFKFAHPRTFEVWVFAEEVSLACQTICSSAQTGDHAAFKLLFNAVVHPWLVDIVMETIWVHQHYITCSDILVNHRLRCARMISWPSALVWKVVLLLLDMRSVVHFQCVWLAVHMKQGVTRVPEIGRFEAHVVKQPQHNHSSRALMQTSAVTTDG